MPYSPILGNPPAYTTLRPDVASLLSRLIHRDQHLGDQDCWRAYSRAKAEISGLVGWDAPPERADQAQYDLAIRVYCDGCGL